MWKENLVFGYIVAAMIGFGGLCRIFIGAAIDGEYTVVESVRAIAITEAVFTGLLVILGVIVVLIITSGRE